MHTNGGYFEVSMELLNGLIPLPEGVRVVHAETHWEYGRQNLRVYAEGPGLPAVPEGVRFPQVTPVFTCDGIGPPEFHSWSEPDWS